MRTFTLISAYVAVLSGVVALYQLSESEFPVVVKWSKRETVFKVSLNTGLAILLFWLAYR